MTDDMKRGTFEWIRAGRLMVDSRYERPLVRSKVRKIVNAFDPDAFGVLYISRRDDGDLVILDGQHRWSAMIEMGWMDQRVPCLVFTGLTLAGEAKLFREYNELRTKPTPLALHRSGVIEGNPRALAIEKIVTNFGLELIAAPGFRRVRCIGALQTIFDGAGEKVLCEALGVAIEAWGTDSTSFNGDVLIGIAAVLTRFPKINRAKLVRELHKQDPLTLLSRARMVKAEKLLDVRSMSGMCAALIVQAYNYRMSDGEKLRWEERNARAFWKAEAE